MADIALVDSTAGLAESIQQRTSTCAVDIPARSAVKFDANGKWVLATASTASSGVGAFYGVSTNTKTIKAGYPLTAVRVGLMDGFTFTQAYGAAIYLSDTPGKLADAPGGNSVRVGQVVPGWAQPIGSAADKLLSLEG